MGGSNKVLKLPTHLLSSIVDFICSQCNEEMKAAIHDELETLKSTISRIDEQVNNCDQEKESSKEIEGRQDRFAMPPPPVALINKTCTPTIQLSTCVEDHTGEDQEIMNEREVQEIIGNEGQKVREEDDLNNRSVRSSSEDGTEVDIVLESNPLNNEETKTRKKTRKLSLVSFKGDEKEKMPRQISYNPLTPGGGKSSSIHPGGLRMSVYKAPVFTDRAPVDNIRMVATDAFNIIDENGDGFLQKEEVVAAITMMEENGTHFTTVGNDPTEIAQNMMNEVDIDGDGVIDLDEFIDMMKKNVLGESSTSTSFLSYNHRMSQLARHVLLAHQKKMENSVIGKDLWMIHPFSNLHVSWDIMVSLLIVLTVFTMPLSLGWDELNRDFFGMNLTVDIVFLFDVGKNFCTGIVDENDAVIMDRHIVRRNYLTGFFLTDFCSSIPLDLIFRVAGADDFVSSGTAVSGTKNSLRMLRLLRMAKLLRLFRVSRLANHVKNLFIWVEETLNIRISDGFTKLVRLGVGALVLGHWIACLNFMLVRLYDFPEDSWVVYAGLDNQSAYTQWSWSFFKALAQMIMIGFETPPFTNASCDTASQWCGIEHWITLCCLYIGAVFYSLLISSISSILQTANLASRQFEEKLMQIDDYMRSKKLPATMREKVKDCFHLQHSNGKLYDENEILDMLTPILKREIKLFTGRDLSMKVPLLSSVTNKHFAEEMVTVIEPMISFQNEVVLRENTTGNDMYFIGSGVVEIYLAGTENSAYVAIGDGCYFGEVSLLLNIRRTASARTKTQCMLFKISKKKLDAVLKDFPETMENMVKVAESRHRRLKHYIDPSVYALAKEDEIDSEDCKTELFGADAEKIVSAKEQEVTRARANTRKNRRVGNFIALKNTKRGKISTAITNPLK